jgi:hypothetical protein
MSQLDTKSMAGDYGGSVRVLCDPSSTFGLALSISDFQSLDSCSVVVQVPKYVRTSCT